MESTHVYIGSLPCGCHVAASVDEADNKRRTAKHVAEMIAQGYIVSRHPLTELRDGTIKLFTCKHEDELVQEQLL